MDWVRRGSLLQREDTSVFKFQPMESHVFRSSIGPNETRFTGLEKLVSDEDWIRWLDKNTTEHLDTDENGMTLLLGGRAKRRIPSMEVAYLPFSRDMCPRIVEAFQIHRSISRVINRNTTSTFSAFTYNDTHTGRSVLVYNCRSSSAWSNDLALSATYCPYKKRTLAVLYGCCDRSRDKFITRLSTWGFLTYHPLVLPTIFAEVERDRHFDVLAPMISELVNRVRTIGGADAEFSPNQPSQKANSSENSIELWLEVSWLKIGLESWRQQIENMISHCDTLKQPAFDTQNQGVTSHGPKSDELSDMEDAGTLIRKRLLELQGEYNEKIRTCATVVDCMVLATQLEWNKMARADTKTNLAISNSSLEISKAAKVDGQRMRSIAVLTMIFLPATFVATVFSMTFFEWNPVQGQTVMSPYIWIYITGTVMLTSLTLAIWYYFSKREKEANSNNDLEIRSVS
ncbi:hypothetical protein F4775DRAFT_575663 [Biscogniauxia sp. FL1348]|nr:hypothetical protein F4775DRAFT_575663 [Biscogniauxia sp. FL1348]